MLLNWGQTSTGGASADIPASHLDLVQCPPVAALTTISRDGYPQTSVVWCDYDGSVVRVNTMRGFAKERNMRRDPRVTLLCYDPRRPLRYLEVRGAVVDLTEDGAWEHLDDIASRYAGRQVRYFGDVIPARFAETEIPVLCRIVPTHVVLGAERHVPNAPCAAAARPEGRPPVPSNADSGCAVPSSHLGLLGGATCGVLTTMGVSGQPQSRLVWPDYDASCSGVDVAFASSANRDLPADTKASLLVVDPDNTSRYVQLRGDVEVGPEDASGPLGSESHASDGTQVTWRIHARRVRCDAVHI